MKVTKSSWTISEVAKMTEKSRQHIYKLYERLEFDEVQEGTKKMVNEKGLQKLLDFLGMEVEDEN
jgi:transposase